MLPEPEHSRSVDEIQTCMQIATNPRTFNFESFVLLGNPGRPKSLTGQVLDPKGIVPELQVDLMVASFKGLQGDRGVYFMSRPDVLAAPETQVLLSSLSFPTAQVLAHDRFLENGANFDNGNGMIDSSLFGRDGMPSPHHPLAFIVSGHTVKPDSARELVTYLFAFKNKPVSPTLESISHRIGEVYSMSPIFNN